MLDNRIMHSLIPSKKRHVYLPHRYESSAYDLNLRKVKLIKENEVQKVLVHGGNGVSLKFSEYAFEFRY